MGQTVTRSTLANAISLAKRAHHALPTLCLTALLWSGTAGHNPAHASLSQQDVLIYQAAFEAADLGAWDAARAMVTGARDPVLSKVIDWISASNEDGDAGFAEITAFIRANPQWPDQTGMQRRAEQEMPDALAAGDVAAWFDIYPPVTVDGVLRYGDALRALGRQAEFAELAQTQWPTLSLSQDNGRAFLALFGTALGPADHQARLDTLLWEGRESEARRMFPLVDSAHRALAEARIHLANRAEGVDVLVDQVPTVLANDEGLVYERVRWRRRADQTAGALDMLQNQPAQLTQGRRWWSERNILARRYLARGNHQIAYAIASSHRQTEAFPLSQAEWLAGWLALRFLDNPQGAARHFQTLYENVGSPISLARGAYWAGRAFDAMGDRAEAETWYRRAAGHGEAFYGQLAADRLAVPTVAALPPDPAVPPAENVAFADSEIVRVIQALDQIGENARADLFLRRLSRLTDDPAETALIAELATSLGRRDMAVFAARQLIFDPVTLFQSGYPVLPLDAADRRAEPALVLGLIRRESQFAIDAVSPAGARGLMQLMPATAQGVARSLGVQSSNARLTSDPDLNIQLGSRYLAEMLRRFDGSYILALAAYNAGPGRVDGWLERRGRPGSSINEIVDWIESIPIYETRNYVQRVLEDTQIYRQRLGAAPAIGQLEADLAR